LEEALRGKNQIIPQSGQTMMPTDAGRKGPDMEKVEKHYCSATPQKNLPTR
jgi:hypothetical protein